jgi:hypothetical protein
VVVDAGGVVVVASGAGWPVMLASCWNIPPHQASRPSTTTTATPQITIWFQFRPEVVAMVNILLQRFATIGDGRITSVAPPCDRIEIAGGAAGLP